MKALLVLSRWSELEGVRHGSGRPLLDLYLTTLGVSQLDTLELAPDQPFDGESLPADYDLVLVQKPVCCAGDGRLRRSVLSSLGLSLGLEDETSDRLKVMGAVTLENERGENVGFAVRRKGRNVVFCETGLWSQRHGVAAALRRLRQEEEVPRLPTRPPHCWMLEASGAQPDADEVLSRNECVGRQVRVMPEGDLALLLPATVSGEFLERLRGRYGAALYAQEPAALPEVLATLLKHHGVMVACAESCTGGLLGARLTSLPGSSAFFSQGFITYSNLSKERQLDVPLLTLKRHGAVSSETALAMARGALSRADADLAVAITGVAGPDGGSPEKPVGTVYLAAVSRWGGVEEFRGAYTGDRERIRLQATQTALHLLRRLLEEWSLRRGAA
ncbi:MAG: nicotinamide-nucleotide amidohydrolase family protein [Magnetococcus sp. WYHC-3]